MEKLLLQLIERLEQIAEESEEIFDSEVREEMGLAIMEGYVRRTQGYQMPHSFGMNSQTANDAVRAALRDYIEMANRLSDRAGITRFLDRLAAFQDDRAKTEVGGNDYEDFFGHTPPELYDEEGNVLRQQ